MNCIYCHKLTEWIATTNKSDGKETCYNCNDCRSYFHSTNGEIYLINSLRIEGAKRKYLYMALPLENIARVYVYQDDDNTKTVLAFSLNHIPDWRPQTMGAKIDKLLVFS